MRNSGLQDDERGEPEAYRMKEGEELIRGLLCERRRVNEVYKVNKEKKITNYKMKTGEELRFIE